MPSADFCTAVRDPRGSLSPYRTRCRSPGVSLTAFTAHLPNLQPGLVVDTGLRGSGPARPTQTASYSVSVRQVAALLPRFLQTAPRGHRPCASLALCLHQTWAEDLHLRAVKHARHTRACGRQDRVHESLGKRAPHVSHSSHRGSSRYTRHEVTESANPSTRSGQVQVKDVPIKHREAREGDFSGRTVSAEKAADALRWEPRVDIEEGIERYVAWYRAQMVE